MQIRFTNDDVELLRNVVPLARHISRQSDKQAHGAARSALLQLSSHGRRSHHVRISGICTSRTAVFSTIKTTSVTDSTPSLARRPRTNCFPACPPWATTSASMACTFQVVGVLQPRMQEGDNDDNRVVYVPFSSMDVLQDTHYLSGIWLDSQGLDHDKLTRTIRESLGLAHSFKARRRARGLRLRCRRSSSRSSTSSAWD